MAVSIDARVGIAEIDAENEGGMGSFYLDDDTEYEAKKQSLVTMPSDWMAQNIYEDESTQTAGLNLASGPTTVAPAFAGKWGPMSPNRDMLFDRRDRRRGRYRHSSMGGGPQWMNEQAAASVPLGAYTRAPMGNVAGDPSSYQYRPYTIDELNLKKQAALVEKLPDWAKDWKSLSAILGQINPLYQNLSSDESIASKLGLGDETVGRRISSRAQLEAFRRLESRQPQFESRLQQLQDKMRPLEEQREKLQFRTIMHPDKKAVFDYSANPRMLPGKVIGGYEVDDYQWSPPGATGWGYGSYDQEKSQELWDQIQPFRNEAYQMQNAPNTFYDLMRHGFLNEQVSLPVAQTIELLDSGGQPSDFYNNMLASKFMRGNPAGTGLLSSALVARLLDKSPYSAPAFDKQQHDRLAAILEQAGISPMSPSSRIGSSMDAWDKLAYQEIMNPGSTGYTFNQNTQDEGLWTDPTTGERRSIMEMINFLKDADWTGEKARQRFKEESKNPGG